MRPIMHSIVFTFTLPRSRALSRSAIHCDAFSVGRCILNRNVLMSQLITRWRSLGVLLPSSFLMLIALSRGRGSLDEVGQNSPCVASGAAFCPRDGQSSMSSIIVVISSMYPSVITGKNGT